MPPFFIKDKTTEEIKEVIGRVYVNTLGGTKCIAEIKIRKDLLSIRLAQIATNGLFLDDRIPNKFIMPGTISHIDLYDSDIGRHAIDRDAGPL